MKSGTISQSRRLLLGSSLCLSLAFALSIGMGIVFPIPEESLAKLEEIYGIWLPIAAAVQTLLGVSGLLCLFGAIISSKVKR